MKRIVDILARAGRVELRADIERAKVDALEIASLRSRAEKVRELEALHAQMRVANETMSREFAQLEIDTRKRVLEEMEAEVERGLAYSSDDLTATNETDEDLRSTGAPFESVEQLSPPNSPRGSPPLSVIAVNPAKLPPRILKVLDAKRPPETSSASRPRKSKVKPKRTQETSDVSHPQKSKRAPRWK